MKKIISLVLVFLLALTLVGCGKANRLNYVKGLDKYVELCDINNISIDLKSDEFNKLQKEIMADDLKANTYEVKEGAVQDGDITNIDYAGKVNGVAFTGGTAQAQTLEIGSGTFIDGFEEQLIGVKIGETVDINVTFPEGYNDSTDLETGKTTIKLAGAKAVFTVKVNGISRSYSEVNDEFAKAAGFDTADAYMADLKENTVKNQIYNYIMDNSKVKELPPDEDGNSYEYHKKYYTNMAAYYNTTFEGFLSANKIDEAKFKKDMLNDEIIMYACLDKLGLKIKQEDIDSEIDKIAEENNVSAEEVKEAYGENYSEYVYVNITVIEELYKIVKIIE